MSKAKRVTKEEEAEIFKLADEGKTALEIWQGLTGRKLSMPTIYQRLALRKKIAANVAEAVAEQRAA